VSADRADAITTARLILAAMRPEDADAMAEVLADERLHEFVGGHPLSASELRARYVRLAAGASDPNVEWRNWIVRRRADGQIVGTMQATITTPATTGVPEASIAWVIGVPWQRRGFASEAAVAVVGWLRDRGVTAVTAHIHPDHHASARVAAQAGLAPTAELVDGERVWRSAATPGDAASNART
jgi:RimJ/RimL family protein N-acetyltransferase